MNHRKSLPVTLVLAVCSLALSGGRPASGAEKAPRRQRMPREGYYMVCTVNVAYFHRIAVGRCEEMLTLWTNSRACDKLAVAEVLLGTVMSEEEAPADGYQRQPGTDDLSVRAGRARWAIERLLRVKLPGVVDRTTSREELGRLHAEATAVVEAYRQGLIAAAADHEISPAHFARLKRQFRGKVDPETVRHDWNIMAMDRLFAEWPPIGRKYDDLVSIIGLKGERQDYGVAYTFQGDWSGAWYRIEIRDGVIWSVRKGGLE